MITVIAKLFNLQYTDDKNENSNNSPKINSCDIIIPIDTFIYFNILKTSLRPYVLNKFKIYVL
jgi:hypothetical protein